MSNSKTVPKQLKPFTKGDSRINRKGRPKITQTFRDMREVALKIAEETITTKTGDKMPVIEAILRQWATSKVPILQKGFVEIAYGKVPDQMELSGTDGDKIIIQVNYGHEAGCESPEVSPETEGDSESTETL